MPKVMITGANRGIGLARLAANMPLSPDESATVNYDGNPVDW
jgi:hypothetical protein